MTDTEDEDKSATPFEVTYSLPDKIDIVQTTWADDVGTLVSRWKRQRGNGETVVVRNGGVVRLFEAVDVIVIQIKEVESPT